jgi:predicted ATPase
MPHRYILTGAPGAGKTVLIRQLERDGFNVVEEAATDVIALDTANGVGESWRSPSFIDQITELQCRRVADARHSPASVQFHDRSVFCTHALATFLGHPIPPVLEQAIAGALEEQLFDRRVFLVRLLGFITPTEARRINLEDAVRFERVHEESYRKFGFELFPLERGSVAERARAVVAASARFMDR